MDLLLFQVRLKGCRRWHRRRRRRGPQAWQFRSQDVIVTGSADRARGLLTISQCGCLPLLSFSLSRSLLDCLQDAELGLESRRAPSSHWMEDGGVRGVSELSSELDFRAYFDWIGAKRERWDVSRG